MPFNFSKTESSKSSNYSATDSPHFNHATHAALLTAVGIHFDNRTPTVIARDAGKHSPLPALERETNYIISHHDTLEMGSMLVWDFPTGFDAQQAIKVINDNVDELHRTNIALGHGHDEFAGCGVQSCIGSQKHDLESRREYTLRKQRLRHIIKAKEAGLDRLLQASTLNSSSTDTDDAEKQAEAKDGKDRSLSEALALLKARINEEFA